MTSGKDKAVIVGVGYTLQGRVPDRSAMSFHLEAIRNAIIDAGLKPHDIDGVIVQPPGDPSVSAWNVAQRLGISPRFVADQSTLGASAIGNAQHAAWAVAYGLADYVVISYGDNALTGRTIPFQRSHRDYGAYGYFGAAAGYAMACQRYMCETGLTHNTLGTIAVEQRKFANMNPNAQLGHKTMTIEEYHESRWVVEPFHLLDCCVISDVGRAFIVTTAERAKDLQKRPVFISGMGQYHVACDIIQQSMTTGGSIGPSNSGREAFRMADMELGDVDIAEIYDSFTYTVVITMEGYGFFKRGDAAEFFRSEVVGPNGQLPINTHGGLLSEVYCMGFAPLTEAVLQLRGEAGQRQQGEPEVALVSGSGGVLQTHSTLVLRR